MSRCCRWVIVCASVGFVAGMFGSALRLLTITPHSNHKPEVASELAPSDPRYQEVMCGPTSLTLALGRLGISESTDEIASRCTVTSRGVAFSDLEHAASLTHSITARIRRSNWDELRRLDGVAVLFVKGDHYVAADPREKPQDATPAPTMRIYEPHTPARWWTREELEAVWGGETLEIVRPAVSDDQPQGMARIDWQECFLDLGVVKGTPQAQYRFSFRNVGSAELVIGKVERSCGCADHTVTSERLAPGESGFIDVRIDLGTTEGYFQQYLAVHTNDELCPISVLRMAGGVPRVRAISGDILRLEELPRGGKVLQTFYAADPGFRGVRIRETHFAPVGDSGLDGHLTCSITSKLVGDGPQRPGGFRVTPSDYAVQLSVEAGPNCPLGPFQGEVTVILEADGAVSTHKVLVQGTVVQDAHPVPRVALVTLDSNGTGNASIQLQRYSKRPVRIVKAWPDDPESLKLTIEVPSGAATRSTVSARLPGVVPGAAPLQRSAFFELDDGAVVTVPVSVFLPPR